MHQLHDFFYFYNPGRLAIRMGRGKLRPDLPFMSLPFQILMLADHAVFYSAGNEHDLSAQDLL